MPKDNEKQRVFNRRAVIFGGLQAAAFSVLAGRLYYLQFIRAEEYATLSENNRIKLILITPERGIIFDRTGELRLADNEKNYRLFIDYSSLSKDTLQMTLAKLTKLVEIPEKKIKQLAKARVFTASMPEMLKDHLSWEEVSLIELNMLSLPGVYIDMGQIRHYPYAERASHLLGYIGGVSESDLARDDQPLMRLPDFKVGKNGIEKLLEADLRGVAGIRSLEVNAHGVPVREVSKKDSVAGQPVQLTVDGRLQDFTAQLVKDQSASVVVMEIDTGNVLALVSMPGFDPNSFSKGIAADEWKRLNANKRNPLLNKAIAGQYPPGSTFKMMVGMAGLEAGAINNSTSVYCPGYFMLGDHRFGCWKPGGHGTVNYHQAVAQSCDTFFYTVAQKIGIEKYADMARRCGLGHTHDIGIIGEKPGIIPDPDWKWKSYKQKWTGGDTINCAIGQGYVLSTPLQLCVMAARIASGKMVEPRLTVPEGEEQPKFETLKIKPAILERTREAMFAAVNEPGGTAYGHRIHDEKFAFAGKTGTSQVRKLIQLGLNQNLLPWEARHHGLFVGFAPADKPKYAVAVVVEHGGGGAAAAAPVAKEALLKIQQLDNPEPENTENENKEEAKPAAAEETPATPAADEGPDF